MTARSGYVRRDKTRMGAGRRRFTVFLAALTVSTLWASTFGAIPAQAKTLRVPADHSTIQAAVDAASNGDTILVAPGVYNENVVIAGKEVTLASEFINSGDWADVEATVIDAGGAAAGNFGIEVTETAGTSTTITGFTLRNADSGIESEAVITISDCLFVGNLDGIDFQEGALPIVGGIVQRSIFRDNVDDGVDMDESVSLVIEDSVFETNGDAGVSLRLFEHTGPMLEVVFRNNTFRANHHDGIQIVDQKVEASNRTVRIEGNLIVDHDRTGVGMRTNDVGATPFEGAPVGEQVVLVHNTIVGNDVGVTGGDNLIAFNNAITGNGVGVRRAAGSSIIAHTLMVGNETNLENSNADSNTVYTSGPGLGTDHVPLPQSQAVDRAVSELKAPSGATIPAGDRPVSGARPDLGAFEFDWSATAWFDDVPEGHLFFQDVQWLAWNDVTRGCNPPDNDRFCPDESIRRGQMAAFFVRALNLGGGGASPFIDDDNSIFEDDITKLAAADITRGCNPPQNDRFCPDDPVSRAQMAAFFKRALDN